jgi:hypothetical protein
MSTAAFFCSRSSSSGDCEGDAVGRAASVGGGGADSGSGGSVAGGAVVAGACGAGAAVGGRTGVGIGSGVASIPLSRFHPGAGAGGSGHSARRGTLGPCSGAGGAGVLWEMVDIYFVTVDTFPHASESAESATDPR